MATPATQRTGMHFLVRPGVFILGGGLAFAGVGLALIQAPDPASDSNQH